MSFYIYSRERTCGTDIFTGTAANADALIDRRYLYDVAVGLLEVYHVDGTCRTVTGAVAATYTVSQHHTVEVAVDSMPDMSA